MKLEDLQIDLASFQMTVEDAQDIQLVLLLDYYLEQGTIKLSENLRLKEMVQSPDKENREVVKQILKFKYNLL
jgi:hypothetical protein